MRDDGEGGEPAAQAEEEGSRKARRGTRRNHAKESQRD
jgi:hypothetical protein